MYLKKLLLFDFLDYVDYIKNLIGVDYVGIGGDYDGILM